MKKNKSAQNIIRIYAKQKIKDILFPVYCTLLRRGFGNKKWKSKFKYFGKNTVLEYPSLLAGIENISIGNNSVILKDIVV